MKFIITAALSFLVSFSTAQAYSMKFAVEDKRQALDIAYNDLVEFQPILTESSREATMYVPGTQEDVNIKPYGRLVETKTNRDIVYTWISASNEIVFDKVVNASKDDCGVESKVAKKVLDDVVLTFTIIDRTNSTCDRENTYDWDVVMVVQENGMTFMHRIVGNLD